MSCLLEHFENLREIGVLELVAAASQGRTGRRAEALDHGRRLAAQVDHVALHESFDAEPHPERLADGLLGKALLDDSAQAGIDHAGGAADDDDLLVGDLDHKIGVVVGNVAIGVHIVQLEMDSHVVLRVRDHIGAVFQEAGKPKFKVAVADDAVEDALLRDEVALVLGYKRPGLAQFDGIPDFGVALVPHGQRVDGLLEGLNQRLGGGQF